MTNTQNICSKCGGELQVGDWPFCSGSPDDHVPPHQVNAQRFDPIVVHRNVETGEYSFPGRTDDAVPHGHEKIEITSIRQADKFCREMTQREKIRFQEQAVMERDYWREKAQATREKIKEEMQRRGMSGSRMFDLVREYTDKRREEKFNRRMNRDPHFYIQVLEMNSSNRNSHSDAHTDWKQRKA